MPKTEDAKMSGECIFFLSIFCVSVGYLVKCIQEAILALLRDKSNRNEMETAVKKINNVLAEIIEKIKKAK